MKKIEVLGSGCSKCVQTAELIRAVADEYGIQVEVIKQKSPEALLDYGVMRTPAVAVDQKLVHSGSVPDREAIAAWLQ